ncbi:MAG: twin-arginine translocation signal domain-containing protein, partial [Oxalobacteraceae bacterium]
MSKGLSRRGFLHATSATAGGLMVGFHVPGFAQAGQPGPARGS